MLSWRRGWSRTGRALQRFPVVAVLCAAAALRANHPLGAGYAQTLRQLETYEGLVATGLLPLAAAAVLSLAGALFAEARGWPRPRTIAMQAAAAVVGFALLRWHAALGVYFGAALPAIAGAVPIAPYLGRGTGPQLWRFLMRLARAALAAGIAAALCGAALSLLLLAVAALGADVPDTAYVRIWLLAFLLAAPMAALALLPEDFSETSVPDGERLSVSVLRMLIDVVAAPFLLAYAALVHVYALLVLASFRMPDGQTGLFVLCFGVALLGGVAVLAPFADSAKWPARLLLRRWPWLLPVPAALLLIAAWLRIAEAGVTPDRYLLALFGLALLVIAGLQCFRITRDDIRHLLIVPVAALFAASFGPHGALSTSIRSQTARFQEMVSAGSFTREAALSARTALYFLDRYDAMGPVLPPDIPATDNDGDTALRARVAAAYGLDRAIDAPQEATPPQPAAPAPATPGNPPGPGG